MTTQQIADQIRKEFLAGQGRISQLPGKAAPEVQKYYSHHKGYDVAVPEGTGITPSFAGTAKNLGNVPGYGQRILVTNPATGQSYYVSHLSGVNFKTPTFQFQPGQVIARSGGRPGAYGAGNSTGPHIDFEIAGANPYAKLISGSPSTKLDINNLLSSVKQKYPTATRIMSYDQLQKRGLTGQIGKNIVKITV